MFTQNSHVNTGEICFGEENTIKRKSGVIIKEVIHEPVWIVNELGELGVLIGKRAFFMYKGEPFEYKRNYIHATDKIEPLRYRKVEKREFGESGPNPQTEDFKKALEGIEKVYSEVRGTSPESKLQEKYNILKKWAGTYDWKILEGAFRIIG